MKQTQLAVIRKLHIDYDLKYQGSDLIFDVELSELLLARLNRAEIEFTVDINNIFVRQSLYVIRMGEYACIKIAKDDLVCAKYIYKDWTDFLRFQVNRTICPEFFLILSDDLFYDGGKVKNNSILNHYNEVCKLIFLLVDTADHREGDFSLGIESVVYLHKSKLYIPTTYKLESLDESLDGISVLLANFKDELHREHKVSILKEVLSSLLGNVPEAGRFAYLLKHFGEFSTRFTENYQLFVSEFSFDSVRVEYEEKKRDYIIKLNDVLASIQTKMLGIPVSLAFLSLKAERVKANEIIGTGHYALLAGVVIYCLMMFFMIVNQQHTLKHVKDEYTSLINRLKYKHPKQHDKIEKVVVLLNNRALFLEITLYFFHVLTAALLLFSLCALYCN